VDKSPETRRGERGGGYTVLAFHMQIYPFTIVDGTGLLQRKMLSNFFIYL
jgi:hypothetical protein